MVELTGGHSRHRGFIHCLSQRCRIRSVTDTPEIVERVAPADCHLIRRAFLQVESATKGAGAGNDVDVNDRREWGRIAIVIEAYDPERVVADRGVGPLEAVRKTIGRA